MTIRKLTTNIDALDFVTAIPDDIWKLIEFMVWDPPYFNSDDPDDMERVNGRTKLKSGDKAQFLNPSLRLMDSNLRDNIYRYIIDKIPKARVAHFQSDRNRISLNPKNIGCEHVWVKPISITMAGNCDRNNGEHIVIEGPRLKGKIKGQILNKYITADAEYKTHKGINRIVRGCAKPTKLFKELYRHFDVKFVLDPFAGWGSSIMAALEMGINIYACDLDSTLDWSNYHNFESMEEMFTHQV